MKFYLGTHMVKWLGEANVPLFVSRNRLHTRKSFPRAIHEWALDSGGFTELAIHGGWRISARDYVTDVRRYYDEIGMMSWAAPQDWMCEPHVVQHTGMTVDMHQLLTIDNFLELRDLAPDLPIIPVLQGWHLDDYFHHLDAYATAGVDLTKEPVVGVGSVCRRQASEEIAHLFVALRAMGINVHGFGVKRTALERSHLSLTSSDSMSWSLDARRTKPLPGHTHKACNNCLDYALLWRARLLDNVNASKGAP